MFPRHWSQSEFPPFLGGWSWENHLASGILTAILGNIYWWRIFTKRCYIAIISQYMGGEFETSWLYYFLTQSGQSPASEPETQAIMDFLQQHQLHIEVKLCGRDVSQAYLAMLQTMLQAYLAIHSFGNLVVHPSPYSHTVGSINHYWRRSSLGVHNLFLCLLNVFLLI